VILVFDSETTGKPRNYSAPCSDVNNWPRLVEIAWLELDTFPVERSPAAAAERAAIVQAAPKRRSVIMPDGFEIPPAATAIHGISQAQAIHEGLPCRLVLDDFRLALDAARVIVGHNLGFDVPVVGAELWRANMRNSATTLVSKPRFDTMVAGTDVVKIPSCRGYKWPKLRELYRHLFGREPDDQHQAAGDVLATAECFCELVSLGVIDCFG
jgi:DNA polymerase III epsilon subunit-like protein